MSNIQLRDLTTIDEFRQVVALEQAIWGYTDLADLCTVPVFIFTVHRGATLIGAFDLSTPSGPRADADQTSLKAGPGRMVGFAYAVIGMKDRRPMHWSGLGRSARSLVRRSLRARCRAYRGDAKTIETSRRATS